MPALRGHFHIQKTETDLFLGFFVSPKCRFFDV